MIRAFALCILAFPALAQQGGQLSLGGTVVNALTGEPLPRALVTILHFGAPDAHLNQWSALTDSTGRFLFPGLSPGRYSTVARKPQFTGDSDTKTMDDFSVELTASTQSQHIRLWPLGVITGKIVDQDGLPAPGVSVTVLTARVQAGLLQTGGDERVTTDDRGVYRIANVPRGKYYVKVAGSRGGTALTPADANAGLADESFAAVYFGGGRTLDSAMPVEIGPGTEIHADFSLDIQPAFKIRGTVVNFVQRHSVQFQLLRDGDDGEAVGAVVNNDSGTFELAAVVSGSYMLRATQDGNTALTPVTIRSADVDGVALLLTPPVDIPVLTHIAGDQQAGCVTQLRPAGKLNTLSAPMKVAEKEFIRGVTPGRYQVSFQCHGGYVRSAISGTQDLATDPILTVAPGVSPPPIDVTVFPGGGSIRGTLAFNGPSANIVLAPQFSSAAGPQMILALHSGTGNKLQFQTTGLAPGSYLVWAFARQDVEYRNPGFLGALTGGVVAQIDGDSETEIALDGVVQ